MGYTSSSRRPLGGAALPGAGEARDDLEAIDEAAEKGALLTRQLLAFGQEGPVRPEVFSLASAVSGVLRLLTRVLPESVELLVTSSAEPSFVHGDRQQVEHVLINLLLNARDAMPNGGRLSVETRRVAVGERRNAADPDVAAGPYVCLVVSDEGVGIPDEARAHLFEPFFTTKGDGGTGLGLSSAYGIVRQAGGDITVESKVGRGSTFRAYLPASDATPSEPSSVPGARPEKTEALARRPATPATILLVEDEPRVRRATARLLTGRGYHVLTARDGAQGVEIGTTYPGHIDLLLTDVVMPKLSGHEVARALRNARPGIQVAYVSGYSDDPTVARELSESNASLIRKPYDIDELLTAIDGKLQGR